MCEDGLWRQVYHPTGLPWIQECQSPSQQHQNNLQLHQKLIKEPGIDRRVQHVSDHTIGMIEYITLHPRHVQKIRA